uniref:Protein kinase domain-containing protein n=2 Tax=Chlamydomonas euryale TaxID=1486919 RepID=A0A7R9W0E9_9CHLO|mmetsp:Transcript_8730/g.26445  ORF Transcript_8730/g.26445 Transcript_8730/m.26445 type:complete len:675 (+) Transcript_8730:171-2195(+)
MFQKVKQLGTKLFNGKAGDGEDSGAQSFSPSSGIPDGSLHVSTTQVSKHSVTRVRRADIVGADGAQGSAGSVTRSNASGSFRNSGQPGSPIGGGVVPAVHVNKGIKATLAAANPAGSVSPGSNRRKSTPAALDMALRTAEGKAAVEELLTQQTIKKPMQFAQYFGTQAPAAGVDAPLTAPRQPLAMRMGQATAKPLSNMGPSASSKPTLPSNEQQQQPKASVIVSSASGQAVESPRIESKEATAAKAEPADAKATISSVLAPAPPLERPKSKLLTISNNLHAAMSRKHWSLSDYAIVRKMYTGYASTVYQATCKKSAEQVALKVYHLENLCELNHYQVYREIRVHSTLQHQNIVHLFAAFKEGNDVVLVQEYAEGGDLYRLLHRNGGRLSERQAVEMVLHPFLLALHYLHTRGIMHRDIKPENVLFTEHRVLKLADFGLAIDLTEERAVTRAGTLDYMAPEVLRCPPKNSPHENKNNVYLHYNNSVDAWAVGVFAYELVVGLPPFAGDSQLDSVDRIMHSTPEFPEKMTELAKAFICQALKKHPGDRPTVIEMLHHPWIRSYQRRASVLTMSVPRQRRGSTAPYTDAPAPGLPTAAPPAGPPAGSTAVQAPLAAAANHSTLLPTDGPNPEDMSPEEIEDMINKLMVVKAAAAERDSSEVASQLGASQAVAARTS